jgi:RHS repeat-associated protein
MNARDILSRDTAPLSQKPRLGEKFAWQVLDRKKPAANDCRIREKSEIKVRLASGKLFPGQYYDVETGKHYNYFRDYDPETGRYIESDPIGLDGGMNTYTYVLNNPLTNIDPTGKSTISINISRGDEAALSTPGTITINGQGMGYTLELPYRNNQTDISSIPTGDYLGEIHTRPNGDVVVRINGVPGRTDILIHIGNYPSDTNGCILPGTSQGPDFVGSSAAAMENIMEMIQGIQNVDAAMGEQTSIVVRVR